MDATAIDVRDLEPGDAVILQSMLAASYLPPAGIDQAGARYVKLCGADGAPVGFAGLELYGRDALLRSVVVRPDQRGHRIGRRAVEAALTCAKERRAENVYLLTTTASDFFTRLGFATFPRDQVPAAIARTSEFTTLCPASAVCMRKDIRPRA